MSVETSFINRKSFSFMSMLMGMFENSANTSRSNGIRLSSSDQVLSENVSPTNRIIRKRFCLQLDLQKPIPGIVSIGIVKFKLGSEA